MEGFAGACLVFVVFVLDCNAAAVLEDKVEVFVVAGAVAVEVREKGFEKRRVEVRDVRNCQQADQNPPKRRGSRQGFGIGARGGFLVAAEVGVEVEGAVEEIDHVILTLLEISSSIFRKFILVECVDLVNKGFAHGNNDGLATLAEACVQVVDEKGGNESLVFAALLIPGVILSHNFAELIDGIIIITTHLLCHDLCELCDGVQGVGGIEFLSRRELSAGVELGVDLNLAFQGQAFELLHLQGTPIEVVALIFG